MEDPEVKIPGTSFKTGDAGTLAKGVDNEPMKIPDPYQDTTDRTKQVIKEPHPTIGKDISSVDLTPPRTNVSNLKKAGILAALAGVAGILGGVFTHRGGSEPAPDSSTKTTPGDQMIKDRNTAFDAKVGERPDPLVYPYQKNNF